MRRFCQGIAGIVLVAAVAACSDTGPQDGKVPFKGTDTESFNSMSNQMKTQQQAQAKKAEEEAKAKEAKTEEPSKAKEAKTEEPSKAKEAKTEEPSKAKEAKPAETQPSGKSG